MFDTIILDIEGTITNPRGDAGKENRALQTKLRDLERLGFAIVLCSGRDLTYIQNFKARWGLTTNSPVISENGCCIFDGDNEHVTFDLSGYDPEPIRERLLELNILEFAEFDSAKRYMVSLYLKGFSSGVEFTQAQITEMYDQVKPELTDFKINLTYSSASIDIMPNGVDKLHGLKALVRRLKTLELFRSIYIGDSMNDLEIGEYVRSSGGLFCVPRNALQILKQSADFVSERDYDEGVLEIFKRYNIG